MDVECATISMPSTRPPAREGQQRLQHLSHPHPLSLVVKHNVKCFACDLKFSGPAYGCSHCNYFLHKSCAKFPKELRHSLHPNHGRLSLVVDSGYFFCNVCETIKESRCNFHFKCCQCSFQLCWKCNIGVRRSVKFEDHEHALCFVEKTGRDLGQCNGYDAYCRQPLVFDNSEEFKLTKSSIFRCLDCDFKLHLLCGPLPSTIKHECHIHPLTLHDSLVEDDSGEYYCDVCETERDPRIRIYYCEECKYFAHVHCVISKIAKVIKLKGVELKALGKDTWSCATEDEQGDRSTTLTLKDLIHQITGLEKMLLVGFYKWDSTLAKGPQPPKEKQGCITDEEISETLQLVRFTEREFRTFCSKAEDYSKGEKLELQSSELGLKLVEVKGYMIPQTLAGVLKTLLKEYGDNIAGDVWSAKMNSFGLFIVCQVVKRMRGTMVKDITKDLLREWFFHLRFVEETGFKIGFALAQWESLVDTFLGLQVERLEDEIPAILRAKTAEIQRGLEKCEEFRGSSEKSEYMKYCLRKASESRWKDGFDCLFRHDGGGNKQTIPREPWWKCD